MSTSNLHLQQLIANYPELEFLRSNIQRAVGILSGALRSDGKVMLCGNGGSAADCEHWAGELMKGFKKQRPLAAGERAGLSPELAQQLQGGLAVIPLTGFPGLSTAFANDIAPHLTFAQLVHVLGRAGDVLVAISTSGNSKNILAAIEVARARDIQVIGLSGQDGGAMRDQCYQCLCVPAVETYRIQEYHLPVYHCISLMLEDDFFPE